MGQNHLSQIAAPKSWKIERKEQKWVTRPMPGSHPLQASMPLSFVIKNLLNYAKTSKEVNKILNEGNVQVDKKIRKDYKFGIGLMDILEVIPLGKHFRVLYKKDGTLSLFEIPAKETKLKPLKIVRKTILKKGAQQITFHDGRNVTAKEKEMKLNVGDGVIFDLDKKEIIKNMPLEENSLVFLSGGKHVGKLGTIKQIIKAKNLEKAKVVIQTEGKEYITLMDYAFPVGKDKPEVKIGAEQ
ncbi:MAG TPA: 30S ribosomal protein S4e [Candidatus Nanoarchaeia archaeon]|nr:30S ribosomal protein S4e [Candidatus Nanoarchaeia archaeon]